MYSETSGVIYALKCVINVTVNNRGKCEFNFSMEERATQIVNNIIASIHLNLFSLVQPELLVVSFYLVQPRHQLAVLPGLAEVRLTEPSKDAGIYKFRPAFSLVDSLPHTMGRSILISCKTLGVLIRHDLLSTFALIVLNAWLSPMWPL